MTFLGKDDVRGCVEESLRRLRLDYVDLVMIHCPWGFKVSARLSLHGCLQYIMSRLGRSAFALRARNCERSLKINIYILSTARSSALLRLDVPHHPKRPA